LRVLLHLNPAPNVTLYPGSHTDRIRHSCGCEARTRRLRTVRPQTLHEIGEQLEAHIRLEERAVFPLVEESLSEAALTELAARLEVKEAGPRVEPWVPAEELSYAPWPGPGDSEGGGYDD
jgi:hypothetical protein